MLLGLFLGAVLWLGPPPSQQDVVLGAPPSPATQRSPGSPEDPAATDADDDECDELAEELARILVDIAADNDEASLIAAEPDAFEVDP